ncbi:PQQ-binding-like beta-propeller repeat protein [Halosimplex sp. TS25]|uniref:outer membrane protein assembly factor BamB family protein n=1 Tax=Halosimplex rarum TaxID=3396619 RepID=UPI0039ED820C
MDDTTPHSDTARLAPTRRRFLAGLTASGVAGSALVASAAGDRGTLSTRDGSGVSDTKWPMHAYDAANSGYSSANAPNTGIAVGWDRAINATGEPTFDSTNAYVRSADGSLYALDRTTGETRWRYKTDGTNDAPTAAAVAGGTAFMDDGDAVLAVRTGSQSRFWRAELDGSVSAPVTVAGDRVLVATNAGTLYSLSRDAGSERWTFDAGDDVVAAPAYGGKRVFVATTDGTVSARDAQGGNSRWEFSADAATESVTPVVKGDAVYIGDTDGTVYALDKTDGRVRWRVDLDDAVVGGPSVTSNTVFVPTAGGTLYALNTTGGYERWTADIGAAASQKPVVTDDAVYVATDDDAVAAYSRSGGTENWRAELPVDDPALSVVDGLVAVVGGLSVGIERGSQTEIARGSFSAVTTRWTHETDGTATGSPALTDDALYAVDDTDACYAVSPTEGDSLWRYETDTDLAGPAAGPDGVYVGGADGTVRALAADGSERWTAETDEPVPAAPVRRGDAVVALDKGGRLYAFDPSDGTQRWTGLVDSGGTSPAVSGDRVFASSPSGVLSAFDAASGEELWGFRASATVGEPAAADGTAYVGDRNGRFYAVDVKKGEKRWSTDLGSAVRAAPTVAGDAVYVGTVDGRLHAYDVDGDQRWTAQAGESIRAKPGVAGDLVTVGSDDESLYAFDAESGEKRWSYDTAAPLRTTAAFGNDSVYVASAEIVALDPPGAVQTPTPTATPDDTPTPTSTPTDTPGGTATPTATPGGTTPTDTPTTTSTGDPSTPTATPTSTTGSGSAGTTVPAGSGGTATPTETPTATPTSTLTTAPGGTNGGGGPLDGVAGEWIPYAGAGAVAAVVAVGALVKRFAGGGATGGKQADALDWGGGLDDDDK